MKKYFLVLLFGICVMCLQSCSSYQTVTRYYNLKSEMEELYVGKSKSYIIENFKFPITDIKHIDTGYEVLICQRSRNGLVGDGITRFYIKNGICVSIDTNEYNARNERVKVSFW